jgi:hypothetical protein
MKRTILTLVLMMALPLMASALSVDFTNDGGTLTGSTEGMSLSGSYLVVINGLPGGLITGKNLGTLSFSTGKLTSGNIQTGATFAGGSPSSFTITGSGMNGAPSGTIFSGSFSGPVTWTMVTLANGTHNYTLTGSLQGTYYYGDGQQLTVNGATIQLTINTGKGYFNGTTKISSGDTNISSTVPEPGSLTLLGTGLVGLAGALQRKLRA